MTLLDTHCTTRSVYRYSVVYSLISNVNNTSYSTPTTVKAKKSAKKVRKVGKYGVNSGNTFRVGNTRYLRQYGADSCIMRRSIPGTNDLRSKFDTGLGDSDLKCDGVLFSLNKKGRWFLPELIKNEIINGDHRDDDFGIQLVERHKIAKDANCVSVCSTQKEEQGSQRIKIKRHVYLHARSLLKRKPRYSRRERRDRLRRGLQVHAVEEEEPEPAQVRYDVLYPSPPQGALTHNPKSIKYNYLESYSVDWPSTRRGATKHRKRASKRLLKEAFSLMDEEIEDSEEEIIPSDVDEAITERSPVTLDDILEHTNSLGKLVGITSKARRKSEEERRQNLPKDTKGRIFHIKKETDFSAVENFSESTETTNNVPAKVKTTNLEPVMIVLPFEQITPSALTERFGPFYIECESFPRKFVLDISDQVSSMDTFKGYRKHVRTVNACLVITMDDDNVMNTLKDSVCKVVLNTNFCDQMNSVKIETMFDYMDTNLDELIQRTLFFMETLPDNSIDMNTIGHLYTTQAKGKQTNLEEFAHWSTNSYQANDEYLFKYFTSFGGHDSEATDMGYEVVSFFDSVSRDKKPSTSTQEEGIFCGICYEMIGDNNPATALISCGHWFCDCCWREHLETKITSGSVSLPCPEYDCEKEVDPGTALSLVTMPLIIKYAKHRHDTQVERLAEKRWCPNEQCGRVLQVNSISVKTAKCQCGEECCVNCLGKPHWPADCDSVKKFQQMMSERGDSGIVPVEAAIGVIVNGKNCPNCNRFVEKDGGCPSMACVCGKTFCWGCGKPYRLVSHVNCYKYGYNDRHGTVARNIDPEDKLGKLKRRRWYKMALVHHVGQHPVKYQKMKVAAKALSKKVNTYLNRPAHKNINVTLDFHVEGKVYTKESDKTKDFLNAMIDLFREVSYLVENVAVLLDSHRLDKNEFNSSLQFMAMRLAMFVNIIYDLFVNEGNREVRETMDRMQQVRHHARNVIRALVKCVSREQI